MARKNTMRNRDYFLPSITTLVLSGLVWFLSCAHQNRMREEEDSSFEQAAEQQLSESNKAEAAPPENSTPAETQAVPKDEFAFGSEGEKAQKTILKAKQSEPIAEPAPEAAPEPTNTAANTSASEEWTEPQAEPAKTEEAQAQTEAPVVSPEPENKAPEIQPQESVPETPRKRYVLTTPKIPSKAIVRGGSKLNRFYFARKGDSPKKVSQLIYGNSNFAKKLVLWNGKIWSPGKVVFYSSPVSPKDKRMASFYQERNIQPDEYQVNAGDWLTRIAKKHLGSAKSWKEIAVLNGLQTPNSLEAGQKLAIYPRNLSIPNEVRSEQARNYEEPPVQMAKSAPAVDNAMAPAQPPALAEPAPSPTAPGIPVAPPVAQESEKTEEAAPQQGPAGEINWNQIAEQNSIAILIGAALIILLLALAARKKRQNQRSAASGSDDSGAAEETRNRFRRK